MHIVAAWRIVAFAVIFIMQIPKGDSGEFTLESTTNVTARNRILASHIITLRNNLCTVRGLCSIMCDFTQGEKSGLSLKKYSIFIQPRFVFSFTTISAVHTHTKSTTDNVWFVSWVQILFLKRLAVISQSYDVPVGFRVSCEKSLRGWTTWPVLHSAWAIKGSYNRDWVTKQWK